MLVRHSDLCRYFVGIPERLRFPENRRVMYAILTTSGAKAVRRSAGVVAPLVRRCSTNASPIPTSRICAGSSASYSADWTSPTEWSR